ncbi:hypothetical protein DDV23_11375, partial [Streptococcus chenjunshii]
METITDKERVAIANEEYNNKLEENRIVQVQVDGKKLIIGKVSSIQDGTDSGSGEQVYVITPNGTADNPESVQEVTVL